MEYLDVRIHDPEEYEGKCLMINGCDYILGPSVGSGVDKYVHLLINMESGLHLSVLAILRDVRSAAEAIAAETAAYVIGNFIRPGLVPSSVEVPLAGTRAFMQDYVGPYEKFPQPHLLQGEQYMRDGRWEDALILFEADLEHQPHHTVLLHHCALMLSKLNNHSAALIRARQAVMIEPNLRAYLQTYMSHAAMANDVKRLCEAARFMNDRFPDDRGLDEVRSHLLPRWCAGAHNNACRLQGSGDSQKAIELIEVVIFAYKFLIENDPNRFEPELAESLAMLGSFHRTNGDPVKGVASLIQAESIAQTRGAINLSEFVNWALGMAFKADPDGVEHAYLEFTGRSLPPDALDY